MRAMTRGLIAMSLLSMGVLACGDDDAARIESLEEQVATLTAERDELVSEMAAEDGRHAASLATIEGIEAILADPESFGATESEIAAALDAYATDDAVMDDAVFGSVDYRTGWYYTLFGGAIDADIDVYHHWLSEDGSQGGSLWVWYGTNAAGNPFELAGISINEYDDDGMLTYEFVAYPYPDEYVDEAIFGAGTELLISAEEAAPVQPFSFADEDLCERITEDEIAEMVSSVYDWDGEATQVESYEFECEWELTGDAEFQPMVGVAEADHGDDPTRQWAEGEPDVISNTVVMGHPEMAAGAGYVLGGFGYFAVGVPENGRFVQLFVMTPEDTFSDDWMTDTIRLGDLVLHELGWVE